MGGHTFLSESVLQLHKNTNFHASNIATIFVLVFLFCINGLLIEFQEYYANGISLGGLALTYFLVLLHRTSLTIP